MHAGVGVVQHNYFRIPKWPVVIFDMFILLICFALCLTIQVYNIYFLRDDDPQFKCVQVRAMPNESF